MCRETYYAHIPVGIEKEHHLCQPAPSLLQEHLHSWGTWLCHNSNKLHCQSNNNADTKYGKSRNLKMSKLEVILICNLIELLKSLMYWQGEIWQDLDFQTLSVQIKPLICSNKTVIHSIKASSDPDYLLLTYCHQYSGPIRPYSWKCWWWLYLVKGCVIKYWLI